MSNASSQAPLSLPKGGFITPEKGHMPTLFSLTITWAVALSFATILIPYLLHRFEESYWTDPATLSFWGIVCIVSTAHGILGYVLGYRKGGSPWNFLWGALLGPVGLLIIHFKHKDEPDRLPQQPVGLVKKLDRICFLNGNLWWGIAQLTVIMVILVRATIYETQVGTRLGSEAAYASYYNSPLMGLILVLFFTTLYCATMRKWPFRLSQTGWLLTHSGLLILLVGCMIMYWGSFQGSLQILEGHTGNVAYNRDERQLTVNIPSLGFQEDFAVTVDHDPETEDVDQEITFTAGPSDAPFKIRIDRYYAKGRYVEGLRPREPDLSGEREPSPGAEIEVIAPGQKRLVAVLDRQGFQSRSVGPLQLGIIRIPEGRTLDEASLGKGQVLVGMAADSREFFLAFGQDGAAPRVEPLHVGHTYQMAEGAPIRIIPRAVYPDAVWDEGWANDAKKNPWATLHCVIEHEGKSDTAWVPRSYSAPQIAHLGGIEVRLRYEPLPRHFPFSISVLDFREIDYPNSNRPMAFETNVVLDDPELGIHKALLIDMNHPLHHRGYRFFNSSPVDDASRHVRGIVLSVSRNPGYPTIIFGSILTTIGIIVVFAFKKNLQRIEQRRRNRSKKSATQAAPQPAGV